MHPNHIEMFGKPEEPRHFEKMDIDFKDDCCALLRACIENIDLLEKQKRDELEEMKEKLEELVGEYL